jgi:hypothetical protein
MEQISPAGGFTELPQFGQVVREVPEVLTHGSASPKSKVSRA